MTKTFLILAAGLTSVVALSGCSEEYAKQSGDTSSERQQVQQMIQALRQAGADKLEETGAGQMASELDASQRQALAATMRQIVAAQTVEVTKVDRFGDRTIRVGLRLTTPSGIGELPLVLVRKDNRLYWAGRN